jgi:tRNA A-37 threonylcarbamoyl transferase component Bud32
MTLKLLQQGAEAKIFLDEINNIVIKDRMPKSYRISKIDKLLIKKRTKSETKLLTKASNIIPAPIPSKSKEFNKIIMPYIKGKKLSQYLDKFPLKEQKIIMKTIGKNIALLHKNDIIHGDLTTSNMILVNCNGKYNINSNEYNNKLEVNNKKRGNNKFKIFLIDFGLRYISGKIEDKSVDLHLLKQALEAKHFRYWKILIEQVLKEYEKIFGETEAKKIFERLKAVEKRGRYKH